MIYGTNSVVLVDFENGVLPVHPGHNITCYISYYKLTKRSMFETKFFLQPIKLITLYLNAFSSLSGEEENDKNI